MDDPGRTRWQSRIVGSGDVDPAELVPNPRNWRKHPTAQQQALTAALDKVGWVQRVIVNRTTGNLVDGHLRVELARKSKEPTIPVEYVELSEQEEAIVLATLDPLAAMAETDKEMLEELTKSVQDFDFAVLGAENVPVADYDYSDLDALVEAHSGDEEEKIVVAIPRKHAPVAKAWLADGDSETSAGFGRGVLRRCGLL